MRDYETEVDAAMSECPDCRNLTNEERETHKLDALRDILRTASRPPAQLPDHVWPNGQRPVGASFNQQRKRP